jgi:hypothetical protein
MGFVRLFIAQFALEFLDSLYLPEGIYAKAQARRLRQESGITFKSDIVTLR